MAKGNILSLKFLFIPFVDSLSCFVLCFYTSHQYLRNFQNLSWGNTLYFLYIVYLLHYQKNIYIMRVYVYILPQNKINCNSNTAICMDNDSLTNVSLSFNIPWELRFNMPNDCERNYSYHKLNCLYVPVVHVYGEH